MAWQIYKVRVDNLTVSSGLKPEETQRKKSKSAEVIGKKMSQAGVSFNAPKIQHS